MHSRCHCVQSLPCSTDDEELLHSSTTQDVISGRKNVATSQVCPDSALLIIYCCITNDCKIKITLLSLLVSVVLGFEKISAGSSGSLTMTVATTGTAGDRSNTSVFMSSQGFSMGYFKLSWLPPDR